MLKKITSNPNFIYVISFLVPFAFYALEWSTIYPKLSSELFLFYLFTFVICILIGLAIHYTRPFRYTSIRESRSNLLVLSVIYILYAVEVAYSRTLPLMGLINGTFDYSEDSFGIPVLHTFLVS